MDIQKILMQEFSLKSGQVDNIMTLISEGKTIPFIARYRKEATGGASDTLLRDFDERLKYLTSLSERKSSVINLIEEQGKMTENIRLSLENAMTLQEVEDIYAPFKQKKRTRASVAKEKGLEPLSQILLEGIEKIEDRADEFINEELEVNSKKDAIAGAMDIVAEIIADDFELKKQLRKLLFDTAVIMTSAKKGAEEKEDFSVYKMYMEFSEISSKMPSYRILAINRGEKDDILKVKIDYDFEKFLETAQKSYIKSEIHEDIMTDTITDSLKRLMLPSLERELRSEMTSRAEEKAIAVFGENLSALLMQSPLKNKVVLGWDPAYRTGCKIAVVDETGKVLDTTTVYPTMPQNKVEETSKEITSLINKYKVNIISIGNGTASRESEQIVADIVKGMDNVYYTIVSEAGASVYSASKLGEEELKDMNVSLRGAVSIARRIQDPMSELVKIEPKSIGVGQYQHDVNQKRLSEVLSNVVEDNVNKVGVDLNTASYSILEYISGITPSIAKNIVKYRDTSGKFKNRDELLKVSRLGQSCFEQCAGFLRVKESDNLLDNTGIHPEAYEKTYKLLEILDVDIQSKNFIKNFTEKIDKFSQKDLADKLEIGMPTLIDIIKELKKPGLDIRDEKNISPVLRSDVLKLEDLSEGMILKGTVRNVLEFGAFVDIGVKNDGLVHISQLSDKYIKNPMDVVSIGDVVNVKVIGIDYDRKKVSLSMKGI
ncbi:Tex-like protein N-terminal domain protein [Peptoanaerobacter stomatis]|uniref:Tex-like protein N-terminal domain protein n=1 Tax=Peptoanaerobacter stomatis TaxID=796937 RepID=J4WI58_9FIRM|nr:Tex family protein [Peptoanaerobacter stomatis]EJU24771.1 Tex-like protein N-terminal domain protein [Peptoanaerobacter stomatis]NWO26024.1 RNA-binding transcriptional accessory protein [Peptostreptococcaceae bacterium oral taxon 081]